MGTSVFAVSDSGALNLLTVTLATFLQPVQRHVPRLIGGAPLTLEALVQAGLVAGTPQHTLV